MPMTGLAHSLGTLVPVLIRMTRTSIFLECTVAVSKKRQKNDYKAPRDVGKPDSENPTWLVPTAVTLVILGPVWIVTYYIARGNYPLPIGNWNLVIGFAFLASAMVLFTKWK